MGVDLTLLPLLSKDFWASHQMIQLERRRELWPDIDSLPQQDIPTPLSCYLANGNDGEHCYGDQDKTPYGCRMRWTTAGALKTLRDHEAVTDNWQNKAVWAWLAEVPDDWPIVLYWH